MANALEMLDSDGSKGRQYFKNSNKTAVRNQELKLDIRVRCSLLLCVAGSVAGLTGCGGPPPAPVSIQLNVQPPSTDGYIYPDVLTATVSNAKDPTIQWQVTCQTGQGSQCGTLTYAQGGLLMGPNANETISGNQVNYLPPGAGVYTLTFTVTSVADPTKAASATITRGDATAISFDSAPIFMPAGFSGSVSALLSADPIAINGLEKLGYTWTVTCGSADCGTFSNSPTDPMGNSFSSNFTTAWGISRVIQYNAPATVPSGGTVTIKVALGAGSVPESDEPSATTTITINAPI